MFRNYLTVAVRNFVRHKLYSFINLAGLTVGLASAIFILLFVHDEMSYDAWEPNSANVYQITTAMELPGSGKAFKSFHSPFPLGQAMQDGLTDVEAQTRLFDQPATVAIGDRQFAEILLFVDPNFFAIIRLPFVAGNASALAQPSAVVLTQSQAKKYFGDADPMGKTLTVEGKYAFNVAGILADPPHNSQFQGKIYFSNKSPAYTNYDQNEWFSLPVQTFVRLVPGADAKAAAAKTKLLIRRFADPRELIQTTLTGDQILQAKLVRLADVHLATDGEVEMLDGDQSAGSRTLVYGFAAIAVLILAIAAFNFTNLATARAMLRAREVGLRKVLGAGRRQLIAQFLSESVLTALLALVLALAAVEILLPFYDSFLGRPIGFHYFKDWPLTLGFIAMAALTGILGGLYPAFVLSGFRPGAVLKVSVEAGGHAGHLRTALVVMQFAVSIGLGIAAMTVYAQIDYARKIDLGYSRDNVVVLARAYAFGSADARKSFEDRLAGGPGIVSVAASSVAPLDAMFQGTFAQKTSNAPNITGRMISVEPGYFHLYGMRLVAGRNLDVHRGDDAVDPPYPSGDLKDGKNVMIDETMARSLGYTPEEAIGKIVRVGTVKRSSVRIVGVVGDVKYFGASRSVDPTVYTYKPSMMNAISVRVRGGQIPEALAFVDKSWHEAAPTVAIRRYFIDDRFDKTFASVDRQGRMFAVFVAIAIFIASLGLFGLAAFTVERHTKEIGLRKVFGASSGDIVRRLLWQFSIPVLAANLIAWPAAWYYLRHWLEGYAYHISLNPLVFLAAGLAALVIAWATVVAHAVAVARTSPIVALRYE